MKQPWIYSVGLDGAFILAPAFIITAAVVLFQSSIAQIENFPLWLWGILIVGVDVSHVYSTLFRTYADRKEFQARRTLYTLTPVVCWLVGTLLYVMGAKYFWYAIAYLAVFHFVRQQFGFMMIYSRKEYAHPFYARLIDKMMIYMATIYPLIYWHTHLPRHFDWFVEGDFVPLHMPWFNKATFALYALIALAYGVKEIVLSARAGTFNIPKNAIVTGTALSWWVGIVTFNNDIAFTAANVLAHGVPYMALIWCYGCNQADIEPGRKLFGHITFARFFTLRFVPLFVGILVLLAYLEEGLWDGMVWSEHKGLFSWFHILPGIDNKMTLAWLVPLLALPQLTHYALDGFIWRFKTPDTDWKRTLFYRENIT